MVSEQPKLLEAGPHPAEVAAVQPSPAPSRHMDKNPPTEPSRSGAPDKNEQRRVALAAGPTLRDLEAAMTCGCSCHPRPASTSLHEGGVSCTCQLTPEQRQQAFDEFVQLLDELRLDEAFDAERDEFDATAAELGVEARIRVAGCPLVITGSLDGQAFYFRERHEQYQVEIPTGDPAADLYDEHDHQGQQIASGVGHRTAAEALHVSVTAVRDHLRMEGCSHPDARTFCPDCGIRVTAHAE